MKCGVRSIVIGICAVTFLAGFTVNSVKAQNTYSWVGATGAVWSTSGNWSPAGVPGSLDTAVFGASGGTGVSLGSSAVNVSEILFTTNGFTLSSGTINLADGGSIVEANVNNNSNGVNEKISAAVHLLGGGTLANYNISNAQNAPASCGRLPVNQWKP